MLSIQECLENIKKAVFGRDVRQSIYDGIKGINDESKEDMKKKQDTIDTYTDKMDLLNDKYEEQIKNLTLDSPSDAEIVDSRRTKDNTVFSTLKERLDEDKNSIWIQKQLTSVATLDETPDQLGLLKINIPANCVLDKDTLSIIPVYKNGDGDALTGSAFTKIEKGEKLEFTIEKTHFDSLCFDILEDQGNVQGGTMGTLEFPVDLNVKFSYLTATETKVNQFVGNPLKLELFRSDTLVDAMNELNMKIVKLDAAISTMVDVIKLEKTLSSGAQESAATVTYQARISNPVAFTCISNVVGSGIGVADPANITATPVSIDPDTKRITMSIYNRNNITCSFVINVLVFNYDE